MKMFAASILLGALLSLVTACSSTTSNLTANSADNLAENLAETTPETLHAWIQAAVDQSTRPFEDRQLDALRKPVEVLGFFGIMPGMNVIDIFGGGGYYTEITSYLVGESGSVTLYNNNPWDEFVSKSVAIRLADNRLPNVNALVFEPEKLDDLKAEDPAGGYDAAILILGMHDIYYEDLATNWPAIDVKRFLTNIHKLLKPGGVLGIIDHNAIAGTDPAVVGKSLHRIDPRIIIDDLKAAGFRYEDQSDILRNPDDTLTESVFKPELRYKTDRSVLKFRK